MTSLACSPLLIWFQRDLRSADKICKAIRVCKTGAYIPFACSNLLATILPLSRGKEKGWRLWVRLRKCRKVRVTDTRRPTSGRPLRLQSRKLWIRIIFVTERIVNKHHPTHEDSKDKRVCLFSPSSSIHDWHSTFSKHTCTDCLQTLANVRPFLYPLRTYVVDIL